MSRAELFDLLFRRVWWVWDSRTADVFSMLYRGFNLFEGAVWLAFAGLVLRRWWRHSRSWTELAYAAAFAVFGLTDFREAWVQSSPLIWLKAVNLAALLLLRRHILPRHYPQARLY